MIITRRGFCISFAAAGILSGIQPAEAEQPVTVRDMAGREVHLPALPKRIVLLEAHDLLTMSLLHRDPASLVVGWAAVDRLDSGELQTILLNGHSVSTVGTLSPDTLSLEGLIALSTDLIVTTAFMTPQGDENSLLQRLKEIGIPVVFSDASSNAADEERATGPVDAMKASLRMWGTLLDASDKAEAYIAFVERELAGIARRVSGAKPVTTYLEVQSTLDDCCWAAGRKNWGELLALAGGQPLPGVVAPWFEKLSLEYLVATPHEVYIASGGGWASGGRPPIGPGIDTELGRQGLQRLIERPGFEHLPSVRSKRVYGIWTGLITNLPLNVLFIAQAARWLHPDRCADIDPTAILDTINRDFAAFPIKGPLWAAI
ncbi:ABC transporter substrate-binding protein [Agrobacterium leguminum]|uniref:ABC-type Fe3+-hydroxamate transport system, periplasmic component n=1 Tax=Agrobacterium deltaense NCPPB 1641 TaxID=1183425 RepID=A0A1S7TVC0_9HYPH|nr:MULTISPECIES: ABC transporter substrate-binding protein [Agrobacterium]WFS68345.1 ABC transporter substrate-binding protein [Agrobacterium leguminum]CVI58578.1 ABC-type Fe3+-hydroxamate transport system, periplasmic component [Agrobacterium deltaense NCPPB 1641]